MEDKKFTSASDKSTLHAADSVSESSDITLDQLVNLAIEKEASDIHFGEGSKVALRVGGQFVFIENMPALTKKNADEMIYAMLDNEDEKKRLERVREIDFSYQHSSGVSFRVNVFYQRGKMSTVMRMISKHLPTMEELGIPREMKAPLTQREGLILVTGTTGSGKSTSIQAMLEFVNKNFVQHIITIENPIEHVFEDSKSIFSQRELGKDTLTLANALHSAMREDPNIIMVSEINDVETLENVLTAVETGHLVIAAMSTKDIKQTLDRLISLWPQNKKEQAQERIADALVAILAQDLVNRIDRTGRIGVFELLITNPGIRNIIRQGNLNQLRTALQSGYKEGMVTMDTFAYNLASQGIISQQDVSRYAETD